jgi:hypothetical protein
MRPSFDTIAPFLHRGCSRASERPLSTERPPAPAERPYAPGGTIGPRGSSTAAAAARAFSSFTAAQISSR